MGRIGERYSAGLNGLQQAVAGPSGLVSGDNITQSGGVYA